MSPREISRTGRSPASSRAAARIASRRSSLCSGRRALGTIARDALGDLDAAGRALQRALICETADLLSGAAGPASAPGQPADHLEALTHGETRVLHYLPTNLSAREIAGELYLSVNTVKTHQRHLYRKLGACSRTQAVERARALGLFAPSARRR